MSSIANDVAKTIISCKGLRKRFVEGKLDVEVLKGIDLDIKAGEKVAIIGSSGSGKSTLLHLLGGLDLPSEGEVTVLGKNMASLSDADRGRLRNQSLGFIYQFHHLLAEFTAIENVAMPLLMRPEVSTTDARKQAVEILENVGLEHRLMHRPGELSGGERQRVAIARALVTKPSLILADEPTGNLDYDNAQSVFGLLSELQSTMQTALLMVTHDRNLAALADRQLLLRNGHWEQY